MAIIGIGGIATHGHIPGILSSGQYEIQALCDLKIERAEHIIEKHELQDVALYTDYQVLLEDYKSGVLALDAVDICTWNSEHMPIARAVAEAGLDFLVEKPPAMSAQELEPIADLVRSKELKMACCYSYRYKPSVRYIRQLVADGKIGRIYHIDMEYSQSLGLLSIPGHETTLEWRFQRVFAGTGTLGDLGAHMLDLVRFTTGLEYDSLIANMGRFVDKRKATSWPLTTTEQVDVDDYAHIMGTMENAASYNLRTTRLAYGRGNYQRLTIYGEHMSVIYLLDEKGDNGDRLLVCRDIKTAGAETFVEVEIPEEFQVEQMAELAKTLRGEACPTNAGIDDAVINQRLLDLAEESAETGSWMQA